MRRFLLPQSVSYSIMLQRPQLLMREFAKLGNECHFINSECAIFGEKKVIEPFLDKYGVNVYPSNTDWKKLKFDTLYSTYPIASERILREYKPEFTIFDSVDNATEGAFESWNFDNCYFKSLEKADLVLATSKPLLKTAKEYNGEVLLVPNATNFEHFNTPQNGPILTNGRPIVMYFGAIAEWLDFNLIEKMVKALPQYDFIFIGATFTPRPLPVAPNLRNLGYVDYSILPSYVQQASASIIPFDVERPEIQTCHPIKMMESFSAGIPVISTAMPETKVDGVYWSKDDDEFIENITKAIEESPKEKEKRTKIAQENTWKKRALDILKRMEELL